MSYVTYNIELFDVLFFLATPRVPARSEVCVCVFDCCCKTIAPVQTRFSLLEQSQPQSSRSLPLKMHELDEQVSLTARGTADCISWPRTRPRRQLNRAAQLIRRSQHLELSAIALCRNSARNRKGLEPDNRTNICNLCSSRLNFE